MSEDILHSYQSEQGQVFSLIHGDLTTQKVDAIVNAANERLRHGGGVAALILQRGGKQINKESREWIEKKGPVLHEQPAYTSGGNLPCKYIIHAVGPIWGSGDEDQKLRSAIYGSFRVADELSLSSIAFSAISTGIFGFPKKRAAEIIYKTFRAYFEKNPSSKLRDVRMVVYDTRTTIAFESIWGEVFPV